MIRLLLLLTSLLTGLMLAPLAVAQQYKWVDQNGRTQYGDVPPPGVKATPMRGAPAAPATAAPDAASKAPGKPQDPDAAFRQRQLDAQKAAEKSAAEQNELTARKENCSRAQAYLRTLESGARISSTDKDGERVYLEDDQRASETAKARQSIQQLCN
jgi:hypothetical protein